MWRMYFDAMHLISCLYEVNLLSITVRKKSIVNAGNNFGCLNYRHFRSLSLTSDLTFVTAILGTKRFSLTQVQVKMGWPNGILEGGD